YVVPQLPKGHDLILGEPWLKHQHACINTNGPHGSRIQFDNGIVVVKQSAEPKLDIRNIGAAAFSVNVRHHRKDKRIQVFSASIQDIEKTLRRLDQDRSKGHTDPRRKLPEHYHEYLSVFSHEESDKLPPHRGPGIDHKIDLIVKDGRTAEPPYVPLYN